LGPADLGFLTSNNYVTFMQKADYDQLSAQVAGMSQMSAGMQAQAQQEVAAQAALEKEQKKSHSFMFHFESKEKKEADLGAVQSQKSIVSQEEAAIAAEDSKFNELLQSKSMLDRMVPYADGFVALTGLGVATMNDLNVRNYRVADTEFSDFIAESTETSNELRSIAQRGSFYVASLRREFPKADLSQLWSVSLGLAKLYGEPAQVSQRFLVALALLLHFKSTIENKMMAAEIMTTIKGDPNQPQDNSDLQDLSKTLVGLDKVVRGDKVPKQLSAGVAALIMAGRRFDGSYPTDRLKVFTKLTPSYEAAAILSVVNVSTDPLAGKFWAFRAMFSAWGYDRSEDTELAAAYLSIGELGPEDLRLKLAIMIDALKNYLEYPLVAGAVLTSIPTLEANETLDLMEKAYALLGSVAQDLQQSELITLAVRMIHGIRNDIVRQLDPTARIANTPIQFTYNPSGLFFVYYHPLIVANAGYFSTFSAIGGSHPAHVHGVGGFMG
jgi:hypothetical protein